MENFVVSARKYRPLTFEDVVGQESITSTLRNAIKNQKVAQAFLFCGPRGVGKTTCARILAKTLNQSGKEAGDNDFSFNVFELDAASNNSVEDIRSLIEQVRFAPQVGKYKVYIIDEVHMLSSAAFNAFLKTLEEPPPHAIFILATTEKHKIIPTILSRCQIFDFKRIEVKDMADRLRLIAESENIQTEDEALHLIAKKADGGLRDALSMFDQIASFSQGKVTYDNVLANLNILDYDYFFRITSCIVQQNIAEALVIFDEVLNRGFEGHNFVMGLSTHLRDLFVCHAPETHKLLDIGDALGEKYREQSADVDKSTLIKALSILQQCDFQYKTSKNQRLLVELSLMQLCSLVDASSNGEEKKNSTPIIRKASSPKSSEVAKSADPSPVDQPSPVAVPDVNSTTQIPATEDISAPVETVEHVDLAEPAARTTTPSVKLTEPVESATAAPLTTQKEPQVLKGKARFNLKTTTTSINPSVFEKKSDEVNEPIAETGSEDKATDQVTEVSSDSSKNELRVITQEAMLKVWKEYGNDLVKKGRQSLYNGLMSQDPVLTENVIHVELKNKTLEQEFKEEKIELVAFLRKKLKNKSIKLDYTLKTSGKSKKMYTNKDRYDKLIEKNPDLNHFRQQLDLEIEF